MSATTVTARRRRSLFWIVAAAIVIGSYYAAEYMKVKRPQRRGQTATATRATAAPIDA